MGIENLGFNFQKAQLKRPNDVSAEITDGTGKTKDPVIKTHLGTIPRHVAENKGKDGDTYVDRNTGYIIRLDAQYDDDGNFIGFRHTKIGESSQK